MSALLNSRFLAAEPNGGFHQLADKIRAGGPWVERSLVIVGTLVVAALALLLARRILLRVIHSIIGKTRTQWDDKLREARFFARLSYLAPAIVIHFGRFWMFPEGSDFDTWRDVVARFTMAWMTLTGAMVVSAVIGGALGIYRTYEIAREFPMRTIAQVIRGAVYFVAFSVMLGLLLNQPVWGFFTGLGALTAVIMLVFKDTILGFVASIQLSMNRMVRRGDWIEMPQYGADGDVLDVSLHTVKVQNWDKTVTTIPTYALVSSSFKNWRGMSESGGRRIKRSISVDMNSVKFCDDKDLDRFRRVEFISNYIDSREKDIADYNSTRDFDPTVTVNGRRLTNLGTFRHYIHSYLRNHAKIHRDMTLLVRQLAPGAEGLPIEIYCFSNDQAWANYEAIQADIFDHLLAVLPEFDLRVYQNPSGLDFQSALAPSTQVATRVPKTARTSKAAPARGATSRRKALKRAAAPAKKKAASRAKKKVAKKKPVAKKKAKKRATR